MSALVKVIPLTPMQSYRILKIIELLSSCVVICKDEFLTGNPKGITTKNTNSIKAA